MKKLLSLLLIICICFCAVGCNKVTDTNSSSLSSTITEIETETIHIDEQEGSSNDTTTEESEVETTSSNTPNKNNTANTTNYQPQIDSLNKTIIELKKQIELLKTENETLKSNIKSLTESTTLNNKYTITKEELIGTWTLVYFNDSGEYVESSDNVFTFTNENIIAIYDDYIFWSKNGMLMKTDYVYYDGLLITNISGTYVKKIELH